MPIRKQLADLIRPKDLSHFVGQKDLIKEGQPLYQIIKINIEILLHEVWQFKKCIITTIQNNKKIWENR